MASPSSPTHCVSSLVRPSLTQPPPRTPAVHNLIASHPLLVGVGSMRLNSYLFHRLESSPLQDGFISLGLTFASMVSISSQDACLLRCRLIWVFGYLSVCSCFISVLSISSQLLWSPNMIGPLNSPTDLYHTRIRSAQYLFHDCN